MAGDWRGKERPQWGVSPRTMEPRADLAEGTSSTRAFVARQIVEDHDVPFAQCRDELGSDIKVEHFAIHRAADHPWGIQSVMPQCANERLRAPVPEGCMIDEALPTPRPASGLDHVGFD